MSYAYLFVTPTLEDMYGVLGSLNLLEINDEGEKSIGSIYKGGGFLTKGIKSLERVGLNEGREPIVLAEQVLSDKQSMYLQAPDLREDFKQSAACVHCINENTLEVVFTKLTSDNWAGLYGFTNVAANLAGRLTAKQLRGE